MSPRSCRCGVLWFLLVLGVFLVGCSAGSVSVGAGDLSIRASDGVRERTIELPAEIVDNTEIILDVMLNGTGPYRMLLDTGSAASQVSPVVARAAGIQAVGHVRTIDAHGNSNREPLAVVDLVEIGGLTGRRVPMTIDTLPDQIADGSNIIGIIGYNMFTRHTLILDYPNEAFFVSDDRLRPNTIGTVRMWLEDGEVPFVGGEFVLSSDTNTKPIDMLIDTGSGALLDISKMYAVIYSDMENKANLGASMSASGTIQPNEYVRLNHDLDFNGIVARNLMGIRGQEWSIDSAIGGDFLRRFKVSLDPVSNRMRFELADGKTQVEMPVWRIHGFRLGVNDDLQLYATEVYPDSEAEKGGLEPGDILLAFDGTPITTDPLNWPGPVLDNRITERAYLIERDGKERTLVLGFQDMIPVPKWYKLFRDVEAEKEITKDQ